MKRSFLQLSPYPTCLVLRMFLDEKQAQKHLDKDTLATTSLLENNVALVDFDISPVRAKSKELIEATAVHESVHVV